MLRDLTKLSATQYDLLVIGGGINGAAIANIAAGSGLKTALIEKGDFASGTSSKSTKLIHGGLRYLENFEFGLVWESLHERYIQLQCAPHLVKPLPFVVPVYEDDARPLWMMRLGVFLYELLAGRYRVGQRRSLSRDEVIELEPGLKRDGLKGGVLYYDARMDDARLCLENVLAAREKGADVCNYVEVQSFLKDGGKMAGVSARDALGGGAFTVRAKKIVCAVGPWTNALARLDDPRSVDQVRTTKGVHLIVKGELSRHALLVMSNDDKRVFFVIPWMGNSMIGTTDTDYAGSPDDVKVGQDDIDYLAAATRRVFPDYEFSEANIITAFAGLRPLLKSDAAPRLASRKHFIHETDSGMLVVVGGKYTTYRAIAEACVKRLNPPALEKVFRLYATGAVTDKLDAVAASCGLALETLQALAGMYGTRYNDVLVLAQNDPVLKERICSCSPFIKAQIAYALQTELAQTADDIISRRLSTGYLACSTRECEKVIQAFVAAAACAGS